MVLVAGIIIEEIPIAEDDDPHDEDISMVEIIRGRGSTSVSTASASRWRRDAAAAAGEQPPMMSTSYRLVL